MAGDETLEIMREIQVLVSDKLQVVSYKWLSRNFSVSSNYAKRLLNDFVAKHGNELEVVYALSGWLKNNPEMYCVKLASRSNLVEVKQKFKDNCSVQIYSVQACIPKDLALLWNTEFVQAEELFSQPLITENCLRDNRYCGVSNSHVKRTVDGKSAGAVSQLKIFGTSMKPKISNILKDSYAPTSQHANGMQYSSMAASSGKSDRTTSVVDNQPAKPQFTKESTAAINTNSKKGKNETSSGGDGSLATLWGRASGNSKASASVSVPKIPITAEAQICAEEAANVMSSDDDEDGVNYKRGLNGSSNRKRRIVMDFSDEDEEEKVVRLASPDPPNVQPAATSSHDIGKLEEKKLSFEHQKEGKMEVKQENNKEKNSGLREGGLRVGNKSNITGISLQMKSQNHIPKVVDDGVKKANDKETNVPTSPKRRKVLKTRIDDRGREVTEVVWEGEAAGDTDKNTTSNDTVTRPSSANKAHEAGRSATTNPVNKAGNKKPAKGGGKDVKQGNILSFFKKV